MKVSTKNAIALAMFLAASMTLVGCASTQEQQQEEAVESSPEEGAANDAVKEANGLNGGEGINNATGGDVLDGEVGEQSGNVPLPGNNNQALIANEPLNTPPTQSNAPITTGDTGLPNSAPSADELLPNTPINTLPPAADALPPAANLAQETPPASEPLAPVAPLPSGEARVKYAKQKLQKRNAPNGEVVGELERGDHPLVLKESDWSQLSNGTYVEDAALTTEGVGREPVPNDWR
jgi:hypothetical protein